MRNSILGESPFASFWRMMMPPADVVVATGLAQYVGFKRGLEVARDIYDPEPFDVLTEHHAGTVAFRSVFS